MSTLARVFVATLLVASAAAQEPAPRTTGCVDCHGDLARVGDPRWTAPVTAYEADVHARHGLTCQDCHGGDASVEPDAADGAARAHAAAADFRGAPDATALPAFCGRCHSDATYMGGFDPGARVDQEAQYLTSVHGQRLAEGDTQVAQCLSCHGRPSPDGEPRAHGILPSSDPRSPVFPTHVADTCGRCHADPTRMAPYGLPTDQLALYTGSVHHRQLVDAEDLSAPTCNDCHGNHGARPPNVDSLANVCGTCHARQAELFRESAMFVAFDFMELGECTVCHGNHGIAPPYDGMLLGQTPLGAEEVLSCTECHEGEDDAGVAVGAALHAAISGLDTHIGAARGVVAEAAEKGMLVNEAEFLLTGAVDALVESRALIHGWAAEPVSEATGRGAEAAEEARAQGQGAIEEYYFRHRWLAWSLVGIALVIVSLVLKIRQLERRWEATPES